MKLKPSVLDEYVKGLKAALGPGTCFCSEGDGLVLEDEGARMKLRGEGPGALPVDEVVTGARAPAAARRCPSLGVGLG